MTEFISQGFYALIASLGFGILMQIRGKNLCCAALGGMIGWVIFVGLAPVMGEDMVRYFVASVVISLYAKHMARIRKAPAVVFLAVAFIPLVPGYAAYQTMIGLLLSDMTQFTEGAVYTFKVVMAIATGFLVSTNVLRPTKWKKSKFKS